jgi:hypothetical protein
MTSADIIVAILAAVVPVLMTTIIMLALSGIKSDNRSSKEIMMLMFKEHTLKNEQQDKHMEATDARVEKHERTIGSHEMRIHDAEVAFARIAK